MADMNGFLAEQMEVLRNAEERFLEIAIVYAEARNKLSSIVGDIPELSETEVVVNSPEEVVTATLPVKGVPQGMVGAQKIPEGMSFSGVLSMRDKVLIARENDGLLSTFGSSDIEVNGMSGSPRFERVVHGQYRLIADAPGWEDRKIGQTTVDVFKVVQLLGRANNALVMRGLKRANSKRYGDVTSPAVSSALAMHPEAFARVARGWYALSEGACNLATSS